MSYKITRAYIRGSWDGTPYESNFTQDLTTYDTPAEFYADYATQDIQDVIDEFTPIILQRFRQMSYDKLVFLNCIVFPDENSYNDYISRSCWDPEKTMTKEYIVQEAPTPEDVNTFDEENGIYYHTTEHLI